MTTIEMANQVRYGGKSIFVRFLEKIHKDPATQCWLWTGCITKYGYGKVKFMHKDWPAHRLSWTLHKGDIPEGLWVLHHCDVPNCVNPEHLFLGTNSDNILDAIAKGRYYPPYGSAHKNSKLTESKVRQARILFKTGQFSHGEIATKFGVSREAMSSAISRRSWKQVA